MSKRGKRGAGGTPATAYLDAAGAPYRVHEYDAASLDESLTLGEAVALQLGVDPGRLFKTLIAVVDGSPACAIVPTSASLSLKALARAAGGKRAVMADSAAAERWTGYVTGGISPIGQTKAIPRFLDASAAEHDAIVVSAGKRGLQIELSPADLVKAAAAKLASLT